MGRVSYYGGLGSLTVFNEEGPNLGQRDYAFSGISDTTGNDNIQTLIYTTNGRISIIVERFLVMVRYYDLEILLRANRTKPFFIRTLKEESDYSQEFPFVFRKSRPKDILPRGRQRGPV